MTKQDKFLSDKCDVCVDDAVLINFLVPDLHPYTLSRLAGLE